MKAGCLLFGVMWAASVQETHSNQSIEQKSLGPCSVNVAGIQGNSTITVNCPGVDPKTMKFFNDAMAGKSRVARNLSEKLREALKEAETWRSKYIRLRERLSEVGIKSELSERAKDLIENGKLDEAGAVLDQVLAEEEKEADRIAA